MSKREGLLLPFLGGGEGICRLDVHLLRSAIDDEVDFVLPCLMNASSAFIDHDHADIYGVSAPNKFTVNDIFHQVRWFGLAKVDAGIPKPCVRGVVLDGIVKITPPLNVISRGFEEQKRIFEAGKIFDNGWPCRFCVYGGLNHVCELCRIGETGNVAHHDVNHRFKKPDVLNLVALHDVLDVNCAEEAAQVLFLFFGSRLERTLGESSVAHIFLKNGKGVGFGRTEIPVFGKRKRRCLNYLSASAKFRGNIGDEKLGVGACHVGVYVWRGAESAEHAVERDVCRFPVVGMDARKIDAWRKDFSAFLYFVNEYIVPASIPWCQFSDVLPKFNGIREVFVFVFLKVDLDDMVFLHALVEKMPLEQVEKQKTLPASSDAGYDLHEIIVLCCYQLVQQRFAFDGHTFLSAFMFMDLSEKMKLNVLYHHSEDNAIRSFQLYGQIHKHESGLREAGFRVASFLGDFVAFRATELAA